MAQNPLSHSQALRVIGQRLHGNGPAAFELHKQGDRYTVHVRLDRLSASVSNGWSPRLGIGQKALADDTRPASLVCQFTPVELFLDDAVEKLRRVKPNGLADISHLSGALRVVGDYLDRNSAGDFVVAWSAQRAKVSWLGNEQTFTLQNLYDLGILMQLRSSNRVPRRHYA